MERAVFWVGSWTRQNWERIKLPQPNGTAGLTRSKPSANAWKPSGSSFWKASKESWQNTSSNRQPRNWHALWALNAMPLFAGWISFRARAAPTWQRRWCGVTRKGLQDGFEHLSRAGSAKTKSASCDASMLSPGWVAENTSAMARQKPARANTPMISVAVL